jgi:CRP-like cAMP-binding protein
MSEFSNIPSLKLLRSVELFTRLTVLQLSQLAESLVEVSFADGQTIVDKVLGVNKQLLMISFQSFALLFLVINLVVTKCLLLYIIFQNDDVSALYVIQRLILAADQMNSDTWDLVSAQTKQAQSSQQNDNYVVEIDEGGHFGEWALIGETISFTAIAIADVTCSTIAKEKFDTIVGPLPKLSQADAR